MADENQAAEIDTDNMSMEELSSLKDKMIEGEDIAPAPDLTAEAQSEPTPVAEPASEDEEAAQAAAAEEAAEKKSETVPHKTFHYERERRKAAEKDAADTRERMARLEERTKLILEGQIKPAEAKPEAPAIPDPEKDPLAAIKWVHEQIAAQNKSQAEKTAQEAQQTEQQREWQQTYERVNRDYSMATEADPTVTEAHNALRQSLGAELTEVYGLSQQDALQEMQRIENQHLAHVAQHGLEIGDYIKKLARTRGWRPAEAASVPAAVPAAPAKPNDKLEQARAAGASLGASGGAVANSGVITPQMLADMPEDEFQAYMNKNGGTRRAFENA